jgi:hypothetical protein
MRKRIALMFAALTAVSAWSVVASERAAMPNVVVILADDLGYADLGCQGSTDIVSPHIDALYNLAEDIDENENRIEQKPEIAARLRAAYLKWEEEVDCEQREQNPSRTEVSPQLSGGKAVKIKIAPSHCAASSNPAFAHPEQWSEVAGKIDAYMIFHTMLPTLPQEWLFKKADPQVLATAAY